MTRVMAASRNVGGGIGEVAEADSLRGTGGLASGNRARERFARRVGLVLGRLDPLHAIGAFLHDAPRAHRDVGIALRGDGRGIEIAPETGTGIIEEVEPAHLVGAVRLAGPRADAAIID